LAGRGQDELVAVTTRDAAGLLHAAARAAPGPPLVIGTAGAAATLAAVHAELNNARYAAEVAARVPAFGRAADWGELGSYGVFQFLPRDAASAERICPGVMALLAGRNRVEAEAGRAFLDCGAHGGAGGAPAPNPRAALVRAVGRGGDLLPVDLSRGEDRLKLHLALRLSELTTT